jgi:hypothetical protein
MPVAIFCYSIIFNKDVSPSQITHVDVHAHDMTGFDQNATHHTFLCFFTTRTSRAQVWDILDCAEIIYTVNKFRCFRLPAA